MRGLIAIAMLCAPAWAGYTSKATVNFSGATGSTQTNITLTFAFSDAKLKTVGNGGQIQNTCSRNTYAIPCDFVFTNDSTCATVTGSYTWGFDGDYSATAGTGHGWILIPSYTTSGVSPTLCIGNAAVNTYQGGAVGAEFDSSTVAHWHFPNGTTLMTTDFTATASTLTNNAVVTASTGQIDGSASFSGSNSLGGATITGASPSAITSCAWVFPTSGVTNANVVSNNANLGWRYRLNSSAANYFIQVLEVGATHMLTSSGTISSAAWHYVCFTANASGTVIYKDGVSDGSDAVNWTTAAPANGALYVGTENSTLGFEAYTGKIDDVSISNTVRTANWIATEYANQNAPPTVGAFTAVATFVANQSVIVIQ